MRVDNQQVPDDNSPLPGGIGYTEEGPLTLPEDGIIQRTDDVIPDFEDEDTTEENRSEETPAAGTQQKPVPGQIDAAAILAKYGNDPAKLAEAFANAQALIARQGNELGTLRKQAQPAAAQPQAEETPEEALANANPATETPAQPQVPATEQQQQEADDPRKKLTWLPDPNTVNWWINAPKNEDGYPVAQDGKPYRASDELGVEVKTREYWLAVASKLEEQYPEATPTQIMLTVQAEQEKFNDWRQGERLRREAAIGNAQEQIADRHMPVLKSTLEQWFAPEVAQELVKDFRDKAKQGLQLARQQGAPKSEVNNPEAIAIAMGHYGNYLFQTGALKQVAEEITRRVFPNGIPSKNGAAASGSRAANLPGQQNITPPPQGGTAKPNPKLRADQRVLVEGKVLKAEEAERYLSDNFEFDGF